VISTNSTYFFNFEAHFKKHYADRGTGEKPTSGASEMTTLPAMS
jgi:hypothetical protein